MSGSTARAAVFRGVEQPLEIEELVLDDPGPREVLIRTVATGVCHSDLHFFDGTYAHPLPVVLGHEAAGIIEAVGEQVIDLRPGDHVITCVSAFCGSCRDCLSGNPARCSKSGRDRPEGAGSRLSTSDRAEAVRAFAGLGTFSERMLVDEHTVVAIDPEMPLEQAALIGCAVVTGLGAVFHTAGVRPGDTVAVFGCGGIGLNCVQAARMAGAARVIAIDRMPAKLELATRFGATDTVDASIGDPVEAVVQLSRGGVDHALEAIGLVQTAEQAFASLRRGGTATVIGMIPPDASVSVPALGFMEEKRLQGSRMGSNRFRIDMPLYVDWYRNGRLELDALVAETMTLEDLGHAFAALKTGASARSVVLFDAPGSASHLPGGSSALSPARGDAVATPAGSVQA